MSLLRNIERAINTILAQGSKNDDKKHMTFITKDGKVMSKEEVKKGDK
jgi:hypothetical protein